jgi:hypothetical protein
MLPGGGAVLLVLSFCKSSVRVAAAPPHLAIKYAPRRMSQFLTRKSSGGHQAKRRKEENSSSADEFLE